MKNITKKFVEILIMDTDGYNGEYHEMNQTYEEAKKMVSGYCPCVREIEKTFNPDTFTITVKVLKETEWEYDRKMGKSNITETVYE